MLPLWFAKVLTIKQEAKKKFLHTLGTAAWNTKSVMGTASEFVAVIMIDTMLDGLPGTFSNAKFIFKPFFSKAVMDGKPIKRKRRSSMVRQLGDQLNS